ncbi:hypothetical protein BDW02DRAFT_615419 [Decorospora gaudefroyi]|uniref:Uncharacterized protein n=1 Tax=Decorospora gaudefroyi TaxID=184978 RepID=A0A6A5JWT6_9PLEO|nr:hypothetical protein BDW02DRAFT_615419 [Decorospora gaudefroyi]
MYKVTVRSLRGKPTGYNEYITADVADNEELHHISPYFSSSAITGSRYRTISEGKGYHSNVIRTDWSQSSYGFSNRFGWIGVNTEYLTDLTVTTTVNGKPTHTTVPAAIVASTATASANGVAAGDVSVALSPKLLDVLGKLLSEAEAACGRSQKRQTCNVNENFALRVAEEASAGGALEFVDAGVETTLPVITAGTVSTILNNAGLGAALPLVGIAVTWRLLGKLQAFTLPAASMNKNTGGDEDQDRCPADAPKGDDAVSFESGHDERTHKSDKHKPRCMDNECKAENKSGQKCKEVLHSRRLIEVYKLRQKQGKYKGCDCLASAQVIGVYTSDSAIYDFGLGWLDLQQKVLEDLSTSVALHCGEPAERWFSYQDGFEAVTQFCDKPDRKLKLRPSGDGLPDAQVDYSHGTMDPTIRIYAYVEDTYVGDKDSEDRKMGGSAAINCQWFNIAAIKGPISVPGHQDPNPPPQEATFLSIVLSNFIDESHYNDAWYFHVIKGGESAVCRPNDQAISSVSAWNNPSIENPPWPGGTFPLKVDELGNCEYKNDGSDPGALWCGEKAMPCHEDESKSGSSQVCSDKYYKTSEHPVVVWLLAPLLNEATRDFEEGSKQLVGITTRKLIRPVLRSQGGGGWKATVRICWQAYGFGGRLAFITYLHLPVVVDGQSPNKPEDFRMSKVFLGYTPIREDSRETGNYMGEEFDLLETHKTCVLVLEIVESSPWTTKGRRNPTKLDVLRSKLFNRQAIWMTMKSELSHEMIAKTPTCRDDRTAFHFLHGGAAEHVWDSADAAKLVKGKQPKLNVQVEMVPNEAHAWDYGSPFSARS